MTCLRFGNHGDVPAGARYPREPLNDAAIRFPVGHKAGKLTRALGSLLKYWTVMHVAQCMRWGDETKLRGGKSHQICA